MPLVGNFHWVLLSVDLHHKNIMMYNSLGRNTKNRYYENLHKTAIAWLRYFLVWRTGMCKNEKPFIFYYTNTFNQRDFNCHNIFHFYNILGEMVWETIQIKWGQKIPKQNNGTDCGLFIIRYLHYIVSDEPIEFDEVQISICFNIIYLHFIAISLIFEIANIYFYFNLVFL
jgi:Ulp1 protease family, C-terminal catalytic domain